jgi:siroheme synthase (precorrin-2 oxidase/ferrochelatase)
MRSYILTRRERTIIDRFLKGKIPLTDRGLSQIRTRLKTSTLTGDLDLLMDLRQALAKSKPTIST